MCARHRLCSGLLHCDCLQLSSGCVRKLTPEQDPSGHPMYSLQDIISKDCNPLQRHFKLCMAATGLKMLPRLELPLFSNTCYIWSKRGHVDQGMSAQSKFCLRPRDNAVIRACTCCHPTKPLTIDQAWTLLAMTRMLSMTASSSTNLPPRGGVVTRQGHTSHSPQTVRNRIWLAFAIHGHVADSTA